MENRHYSARFFDRAGHRTTVGDEAGVCRLGGEHVSEDREFMKKGQSDGDINISKFCVGIFVIYWALIFTFFFLAGDQLHLRASRGNLAMSTAESGTVELVQGAVV